MDYLMEADSMTIFTFRTFFGYWFADLLTGPLSVVLFTSKFHFAMKRLWEGIKDHVYGVSLKDIIWKTTLICARKASLVAAFLLFTMSFFPGTSLGEIVISAHTDNPDPVAAHGIVTYTIVVSNNTPGVTYSNVTLTDTLPATTQLVSATPPAGVTCSGVPVGSVGMLTCTGLSLAGAGEPGDSAAFVVLVRTTAASRIAGTITNSATVSHGTEPPFTQDESTTVNAGSDIALTKSASPSPVSAGGVISYTLTLTNNGPDNASSLVVTDTLPPNCTITGSLPGGCSSAGQVVTCSVAALANGSTSNVGPIQCIAGVAGGSTLTNVATVSAGAASPDNLTDNNTATTNTPVTAGSDVSVIKTKSLADPVFVNNTFNFVLTPRYSGDFPSGATMTDVVPAQFTINNSSPFSQNGWNCSVSGQTVSCTRTGSGFAGVNQALGIVNISVTANTAVASVSNSVTISPPTGVTDPTPGNNTSTLTFQVRPYEADFSSTKTRTVPNTVAQNVPFNFTLAARNNGPATFTGTITLTDTLPAGFTINSYGTASGFSAANCTPVAASLPASGPVTIICTRTVTNLAANTSAGSIVINVTPTALGTLTNNLCVSTSGTGPADETPANDCTSNTVTSQINTDQANISVTKTASPNPVIAGQLLTYTVEVVNAGPNSAQNVLLTDSLTDLINGTIGTNQGVEAQPTIVAGLATIPVSGSASCRIASTGSTSAQLNCTITSLQVCTAGSDCPTFTFGIRPAASTNPSNSDLARTNTATAISQETADPDLTNNTGTVTSDVSPRIDMAVTKTDSPDPVPVGQNLTYVITVRNNGPSRAYGVSITDTLPDNVTFISATSSTATCGTTPTVNSTTAPGNNTVVCTWATQFNSGVQRTVTVVVRPNYVTRGTTISNSVVVATTSTDTNNGNNSATATTTVSNPAYDLLINKTDSPDPVTVGDDVTYTIVVTNNGASFAENVRIVDTLPSAGLSYRSFSPGTGVSCTTTATVGVIGGTVTCDIAGIATGATRQAQIVLRGEAKGTYINSATVSFQDPGANAYDPQTNNTATQPTTVRTRADVQVVSKQAMTTGTNTPIGQIEFRRSFDWLVNVQNNGPAEADTVTFSDTLPTGMELTGPPAFTATAGSFTPAAPTCTGSAGSTSFTCSITSMPVLGTATVRFPVRIVTFPSGGTTTNRATIITTDSFDTNGGNNPNAGNNYNEGTITVLASSVAGTVYRDLNNNGAIDSGETGISGATLTITGTAFDGTTITRSVTTDGNGNFIAAGLPEGTYTITETNGNLPAGYVDGRESLINTAIGTATIGNDVFTGIVLPGNTTFSGYLFGETPGIIISGVVLNDTDASGTNSAGDTAISGVTMTLAGTNDRGETVNCSITTNASGVFSFTAANCTNLRATTTGYTLTETQPSGYLPGNTFVGTVTGTGAIAGTLVGGTTGNVVQGIILPPGGTSINNTFLEVRPTIIAGYVYLDLNGSAVRDAGETVGVSGVTVVFSGTNDLGESINCTITTGSGGSYQFPNASDPNPLCQTIRPGTYTLTETKPAGLTSTGAQPGTPVNGTGSPASPPTTPTQVVSNIVINGIGTALSNYNFGHQGTTAIGGSVYIDTNNNGIRDTAEPGIPGIAVTLSGTAAAGGSVCSYITCTVATDINGYYSFINIPGSDSTGYTLRERDGGGNASSVLTNYSDGIDSVGTINGGPVGTPGNDIISAIVIDIGQVGSNYNFGELGASLSGSVYIDANDDGIRQGGETGIANVTITLSGTTSTGANVCTVIPSCTVTTAGSGNYSFINLPGGTYTLTETQPPAYADGRETAGSSGGTVNNASFGSGAATNQISAISFAAGVTATGYLFGERTAGISGYVYIDTNNNGIREAGETGIAGNTIILTGTDVDGGVVNLTVQTGADGSYSFGGLKLPNTTGYTITQPTAPVGYLDGSDQNGAGAGNVIPNSGGRTSPESMNVTTADFAATQNGQLSERNFGELQASSLSGSVYNDINSNLNRDIGEGLPGVTITLTGTDDLGNSVTLTTTTDANGAHSFPSLRPGTYTVTETQPAGISDGPTPVIVGSAGGTAGVNTVTNIVLASGKAGTGYDFIERASSLSGYVYLDANNNGIMDIGETSISGVTITLTGTDSSGPVNRTTTTTANGSYVFNNLTSGTYTLTETQPILFADGLDSVGSAGGNLGNDVVSNIPLAAGTNGISYNFGERTGLPGQVSGRVWFDANHDRIDNDGTASGKQGWIAELVRNGAVIQTTTTDANGNYSFTNVTPNTGYEIRFRNPYNNSIYGIPKSDDPAATGLGATVVNGIIVNITVWSGANIIRQDLPLDPGGVIYNAVSRVAVAGSTITINGPAGFRPADHLLGGIANASQVTGSDGLYQFLLLSGTPAGQYTLSVTAPANFVPFPSTMIPACTAVLTVGGSPAPLVVQTGNGPPSISIPNLPPASCAVSSAGVAANAGTTQYYLNFSFTPGVSANVVNNHIPLDPILGGAIIVQKTTPLINVAKGDLVPYTITATNTLSATLVNIDIHDRIPPGFQYRKHSATLNGSPAPPVVKGRDLTWKNLTFAPGEKKTFKLILVVGPGVGEGEYTNTAWAMNNIVNTNVSNIATATVRVIPDPTFDCTDVIGKVFDDKNVNGYQDDGEPGIPNVRIATARGLLITADKEGRFHIPCAVVPNPDRGSNFIMKVDERTLPSGYRMTTENPRVVRATRGKMVKINFGAAIHRVVRIDITGAAFEATGNALQSQWREKLEILHETLKEKPSVVRIGYKKNGEPKDTIKERIKTIEKIIHARWKSDGKEKYPLIFEEEIEEGR